MAEFLSGYPYFIYGLLLTIIIFIVYFLNPRHRIPLMTAALMGLPNIFFSLLFSREGWNPRVLFSIGGIAPEDILFCFYSGGLAWILSTLIFWKRIETSFDAKNFIKRYIHLALFATFWVIAFSLVSHLSIYYILMVIMLLWLLFLLLFKKMNLSIALSGAVFGFLYALISYRIQLYIWPQLSEYWNFPILTGISLWGIPMEELMWLILYFPTWGVSTGYFLNIRVSRKQPV